VFLISHACADVLTFEVLQTNFTRCHILQNDRSTLYSTGRIILLVMSITITTSRCYAHVRRVRKVFIK